MTTPDTTAVTTLLDDLDAQCADYQAMYREGVKQRDCLRQDDLTGLHDASERIRGLMDQVRLRQRRLPADLSQLEKQETEIATRIGALRQLIRSVLDVRDQSENAAHVLLEETRRQLRQADTGRRASRRYQQPSVQDARFVDGIR